MDVHDPVTHGNGRGGGWPQLSPDGKRVVYLKKRGKVLDFSVIPTTGQGRPRRLKHTADAQYGLVWSPDNDTLAYSEDGHGYLIDANNGRRRQIGEAENLAWSPDGHHLAVVTNGGLELIDLHGNVIRLLGKAPVGGTLVVSWAPGPEIAYIQDNGDSSQSKCGD